MSTATQVRLATDVAAQFRHLPAEDAVAAVEAHLRTFWAPGMRAQLVDAVRTRPDGIDPIVVSVARHLEATT